MYMFLNKHKNFFSINSSGFSLIDIVVGVAVFAIFAVGVYEGIRFIYKVVYTSRVRVMETAVLSELLETIRNMPFENVGVIGGVPDGDLPYSRTIVRDGTIFNVTTTIRNIDDPFDGTVTSTPQDTSPADYKLVELSISCPYCLYNKPINLSTIVAPRGLEGESYNGSIFINVFDGDSQPVVGATVHVVNNGVTPPISITDVTDNDGYLRIIDTATGTATYEITISKSGYSTDFTTSTTEERPMPANPHLNVISRTVTEAFFSIDELAEVNIHTINQSCTAAVGKTFHIWGSKLIGLDPEEPKYDRTFISGGSGEYYLPEMEWDDYSFDATTTGYDIAGTIPMMPVAIEPGSTQDIYLLFQPHSTHSVLFNIKDQGTGLPLSSASLELWKTGYDETLITGLGYTRQTDWSGGNGQILFEDDATRYFSDDGNVDTYTPAGDLKLADYGGYYASSGYLESSTFDLGEAVNFQNILWDPFIQAPQTGANPVRFQIATSNSSSPASWDFLGPDGTAGTYYTATNTIIYEGHDSQRYLRYRAYLSTEDQDYTPQIFDIEFTYTNTCVSPGQVFFSGLDAGSYQYEIVRSGYVSVSGSIDIAGNVYEWVSMVSE